MGNFVTSLVLAGSIALVGNNNLEKSSAIGDEAEDFRGQVSRQLEPTRETVYKIDAEMTKWESKIYNPAMLELEVLEKRYNTNFTREQLNEYLLTIEKLVTTINGFKIRFSNIGSRGKIAPLTGENYIDDVLLGKVESWIPLIKEKLASIE